MFNTKTVSIEWGGQTLTLETGKVARQADGAEASLWPARQKSAPPIARRGQVSDAGTRQLLAGTGTVACCWVLRNFTSTRWPMSSGAPSAGRLGLRIQRVLLSAPSRRACARRQHGQLWRAEAVMPTECTQQMLEFAHRRAFPPIPR